MRTYVTVSAQPIWRLRLGRGLPRYALYALSAWGVLASARYAIAPPRPVLTPAPKVEAPDRAAEGFASLFARRYLSWNAAAPQAYQEALAPFLDHLDPLGFLGPAGGELHARLGRHGFTEERR